jgi:16S rRNA (cytosine967-C5)-methyltransferase
VSLRETGGGRPPGGAANPRGSAPRGGRGPRNVTPARTCAFAVLRRVFEEGAWADRALRGEAERLRLDPRERALTTRIAYGAVQRRATLDHLIAGWSDRPPETLEPAVLAALRLGVFQLAYLDRVPAHAAVGESVELAKASSRGGAGLVNAVLRRAAREAAAKVARLRDTTPAEAALAHSHPEWIAALWWEAFGADTARALLRAGNRPAEAALRANLLRTTPGALAERLPIRTRPAPGPPSLPEALVLDAPFDAHGAPEWEAGLFMPQSRAAMAVARLLDPRPGERVLDLCAAPGGKTTHLAALQGDRGRIVAVERHAGRAEALRRTAERLGARSVEVRTADATTTHEAGAYDRVLVDPPCSDLGTLASRPDARWRKAPDAPARLARTQGAMLAAGASALRRGGTLVYSTCTLSPAENEDVVTAFLARNPEFSRDDLSIDVPVWQHPSVPSYLLTLPHRDGTEGFFMARLRRGAAG